MSVTEFIQSPPSSAAPPDDPRRWAILATVCLALILIVIDNTILNVALPTIQRELDASSSELQWMVDSYVLVFAGLLLLAGAIGDRFGKRRALTGGLAVFGIGSLMATFAGDAGSLVATRGLMGIGAAFIMPATLSILIDVFQRPDERAKAIGIWSAVAGLGLILGPVVGGWLVEHVSWQAVFAVNVPLVVVAVGLVARLVPTSKRDDHAQLDLVGAGLSVAALGLTLYGIIEAPSNGWTAASTIIAVGVGVALGIGFVVWESSTPHPMLPLEFFRNPTFAGGAAAIGVTFFGLFGAMFLSTQYFQSVQGYSGFEAGVRTLPIGVIIVAAPLSAKLAQRVGAGPVVASGMGVVAAGLLLAGRFAPNSSYFPHIVSALILLGVGMGMIVAPATEAVMSSVPASQAGVGSAVNDTVREVGGAFGIAVLGSITNSVYRSRVDELGAGDGLTAEQTAHVRDGVGGALHAAARMDPDIGGPVVDAARLAYTDAAGRGFTIAAVVLAAGALILGWAMRGGPGRSQRSHSDRPGLGLTVQKSNQHHQKGSTMTTRTRGRHRSPLQATANEKRSMTTIKHDTTSSGEASPRLRHVHPNPLRDIHKGIRAALFAVTSAAGRVDPADDVKVAALESDIADVAKLLADHAHHEDDHFDLSILPADLGERLEREHALFDARLAWLIELGGEARIANPGDRRQAIHELYIEMASFTGAYLAHQDFEERILVPALVDRIGAYEVLAIHSRIIAGMSPEQFTRGAVAMFPALNIDDRFEMLAGMRAGMPDNAFAGVWSLAASVLAPQDTAGVAARLGLDASPHGRAPRSSPAR